MWPRRPGVSALAWGWELVTVPVGLSCTTSCCVGLLACLETGPVPAYSHALERRSSQPALSARVLSTRSGAASIVCRGCSAPNTCHVGRAQPLGLGQGRERFISSHSWPRNPTTIITTSSLFTARLLLSHFLCLSHRPRRRVCLIVGRTATECVRLTVRCEKRPLAGPR